MLNLQNPLPTFTNPPQAFIRKKINHITDTLLTNGMDTIVRVTNDWAPVSKRSFHVPVTSTMSPAISEPTNIPTPPADTARAISS